MGSRQFLTPQQLAFIEGGVSINAASCGASELPSLARALGCRTTADGSHLTLFFPHDAARDLLADLRQGGRLTAVFSDPDSHETLQIKGGDAREVALEPGDAGRVGAYQERFTARVVALGFPEALMRSLLSCPLDQLIGVCFAPSAVICQTPGPLAGQPLADSA